MKLSEAIRLGAMMCPQVFHGGTVDGRCALKSAALALGNKHPSTAEAEDMWPWLKRSYVTCPECLKEGNAGFILEFHLNDHHEWTRERIADWVATIEPQEVVQPETVQELAVSLTED